MISINVPLQSNELIGGNRTTALLSGWVDSSFRGMWGTSAEHTYRATSAEDSSGASGAIL